MNEPQYDQSDSDIFHLMQENRQLRAELEDLKIRHTNFKENEARVREHYLERLRIAEQKLKNLRIEAGK